MGNTKAIGRRGRVLRRANDRAQRRFHAMLEAHVWPDPTARATQLYIEAERLVDEVMSPDEHPLPVLTLEDILRTMRVNFQVTDVQRATTYENRADEYRTRGA